MSAPARIDPRIVLGNAPGDQRQEPAQVGEVAAWMTAWVRSAAGELTTAPR